MPGIVKHQTLFLLEAEAAFVATGGRTRCQCSSASVRLGMVSSLPLVHLRERLLLTPAIGI